MYIHGRRIGCLCNRRCGGSPLALATWTCQPLTQLVYHGTVVHRRGIRRLCKQAQPITDRDPASHTHILALDFPAGQKECHKVRRLSALVLLALPHRDQLGLEAIKNVHRGRHSNEGFSSCRMCGRDRARRLAPPITLQPFLQICELLMQTTSKVLRCLEDLLPISSLAVGRMPGFAADGEYEGLATNAVGHIPLMLAPDGFLTREHTHEGKSAAHGAQAEGSTRRGHTAKLRF